MEKLNNLCSMKASILSVFYVEGLVTRERLVLSISKKQLMIWERIKVRNPTVRVTRPPFTKG